VLTLTASGSVSDYSDTSSLQEKIAAAAGVAKSFVTISVAAASVIITATVKVPASTTAAEMQTLLSSKIGTAASASAALGITVESDPAIAIKDDSSSASTPVGAIVGGTIGGVAGIALIFGGIAFWRAREKRLAYEYARAAGGVYSTTTSQHV